MVCFKSSILKSYLMFRDGVKRLGYSLPTHSIIILFNVKGNRVIYDHVNIRTAKNGAYLAFWLKESKDFFCKIIKVSTSVMSLSDTQVSLLIFHPNLFESTFRVLLLFDQRHLCKWCVFLSFPNIFCLLTWLTLRFLHVDLFIKSSTSQGRQDGSVS